jgi:adenylate cyclase
MSRRLMPSELAAEAGVDEAVVAEVLELGAMAPGDDGRFDPRDTAIVATVAALLQAGFEPDDLRWLMAERTMRFDVIGRLYADQGPPSARSVADIERTLGPAAAQLERLYAALGLPAPGHEAHLATGEEALIEDYLLGWLTVDPSGASATRVARAARDAVAHVTETWLDAWDAAARPSLSTQGAPAEAGVAVAPESAEGENPTVRMADIGRRLLPMLLDRSLQAALNARIVAAVERALVEGGRVPARPRRPSAVAFVDLSGFTTHTVEAGDEAAAVAAERLREVADARIRPLGGRLVKVLGDGVLLLFEDAATAVTATLGIVQDCEGENLLPAHAAIAAGRVVRREGDVYGATVNLAARLLAAAGPGEVVVEEGVVVALPRGTATFEPLGRIELRGFPMPVAVWRATPSG